MFLLCGYSVDKNNTLITNWCFFLFVLNSLNSGSYTCKITDSKLLNQILNSEPGDAYTSDIFEICWNGYLKDQVGSFMVYLKLVLLPETWKNIDIMFTIESPQTFSKKTSLYSFKKSCGRGWGKGTLYIINFIFT